MKKIILDHDLGSDCDDAGGISICVKAHKKGDCRVLAITHSIADHNGSYAALAIAEYFGVKDIEFGINLENNKLSEAGYDTCTKYTVEKYFKGRELPKLESNVKLLRRIFAENNQKDITFAMTGPFITVHELLRSGPDEISPKTGRELFCENVCEYVCGACNFIDPNNREWNIRADTESALSVVNSPVMPITFAGNNIGGRLMTGQYLRDCDVNYPVRDCYFLLHDWKECVRNSWDLVTAHYAIYGEGHYWKVKRGYSIEINENANTKFAPGGIHSYLEQVATDEEVTALLNHAMMYD